MTRKFFCGITPGSPTVGTNFLTADFLQSCKVDSLIIDKTCFDGIGDIGSTNPDDWPDYVHDLGEGKITLVSYGDFQFKCRLVVNYTPLCPVPNPCQCPE